MGALLNRQLGANPESSFERDGVRSNISHLEQEVRIRSSGNKLAGAVNKRRPTGAKNRQVPLKPSGKDACTPDKGRNDDR
jgi:hypothetical protein